jgi:hypothetical protein
MTTNIEWTCEVCKSRRPNDLIDVYKEDMSRHFQCPPGTSFRNIKYCIDNPACVTGAVDLAAADLARWRALGMGRTIAIDFDGTLATNHAWVCPTHIEDPIDGAKEFCEQIKAMGLWITIHSCRNNPELNGPTTAKDATAAMAAWLVEHEIPFDDIWDKPGKPIASAYVDDRAVSCRPVDLGEAAYDVALQMIKLLAGVQTDAVPGQ